MRWWGSGGSDSLGDEEVQGVKFLLLDEVLDFLNDYSRYLFFFFICLEWIVSGRRRMWGEMRKRKKNKKLGKLILEMLQLFTQNYDYG